MEENKPDQGKETPEPKPFKEKLYDKIPLTFRQIDAVAKILLVLIVIVLVAGIISGNR